MRITNIITTTHLNTRLDLSRLAIENAHITYNPQKFSAASWRHPQIHGTLVIFPNGKLIHLGPPNIQDPSVYIMMYVDILQKQGYTVHLSPIKRVSMSATHKLSGPIKLSEVALNCPCATYEPEFINMAIVKRPECTVCVFHTGTLVITGLKTPSGAYPIALELELLCT